MFRSRRHVLEEYMVQRREECILSARASGSLDANSIQEVLQYCSPIKLSRNDCVYVGRSKDAGEKHDGGESYRWQVVRSQLRVVLDTNRKSIRRFFVFWHYLLTRTG
jgi:hypothetical protein